MASKEDEVGASGDSHGHTQADNAAMMAKLASIADRVTKKTRAQMPPIATPGRVLLKEGVVLKKGTQSMLRGVNRRRLFLFNDMLLLMGDEKKGRLSFHQAVPLASARIRDLMYTNAETTAHPDNSFELVGPARSYELFTESPEDKLQWIAAIKQQMVALAQQYTPERTEAIGWHHDLVEGTLWWAARTNDTYAMGQLLRFADAEEGESVGRCATYCTISANAVDVDGYRPIHYAAMYGHADIIKLLLAHEADGDAADPMSCTPLQTAVKKGSVECIQVLLDNDVDVDCPDLLQATALHNALMNCETPAMRPRIVAMLLTFGADVEAVDCEGCTPLHLAAAECAAELIAPIVHADADVSAVVPGTLFTPLHSVVAREDLLSSAPATVVELLKYGIQPNARDSEGRTALHLAVGLLVGAATSSPQAVGEIVHALLQAGARPNICATASPDSTVEKMVRKAGMSSLWSSMQASAAKFARKQAPPAASSPASAKPSHRVCDDHAMQPDSSSRQCQLCGSTFSTFTNRRHHCRKCGLLLCGACTTKRFPLFGHDDRLAPQRSCDGCFNRMCTDHTAPPSSKPVFEKMPARSAEDVAAARKRLLSGRAGQRDADDSPGSGAGAGAGAGAGGARRSQEVQDGMSQTKNALEHALVAVNERGQKLDQLDEKMRRLNDTSADFAKQCEQIARNAARGAL